MMKSKKRVRILYFRLVVDQLDKCNNYHIHDFFRCKNPLWYITDCHQYLKIYRKYKCMVTKHLSFHDQSSFIYFSNIKKLLRLTFMIWNILMQLNALFMLPKREK